MLRSSATELRGNHASIKHDFQLAHVELDWEMACCSAACSDVNSCTRQVTWPTVSNLVDTCLDYIPEALCIRTFSHSLNIAALFQVDKATLPYEKTGLRAVLRYAMSPTIF
jgi:hypothetical protein